MINFKLNSVIIRPMIANDLSKVANIHEKSFTRQSDSSEWIECNFKAYPRMLYYVAEFNKEILGFVHWSQKSGFRQEVVLELEQIAVDPLVQSKGLGTLLIDKSIPLLKKKLLERNAIIKRFLVSTRTDNDAQKLYKKTLNAKPEAIISNLYSSDEIFMVGSLNE